MSSEPKLEEFINKSRIIRILVRQRLDAARKRRRKHLVQSLSSTSLAPPQNEIYSLLPPRSVWGQFRPKKNKRYNDEKDSINIFATSMVRAIVKQLDKDPNKYEWSKKLSLFIDNCQKRVLHWSSGERLEPDKVLPIPKEKSHKDKKYRIVVSYSIEDSIISNIFASYFRAFFEPAFEPGVLAFRGSRDGWEKDWSQECYNYLYLPDEKSFKEPSTHHDAIKIILKFKEKFQCDAPFWVSECDIKGFFDAVDHSVVRYSVENLSILLGRKIDERAKAFLDSFLDGYNYTNSAYIPTLEILMKQKINDPKISNPQKDKAAIRGKYSTGSFGMPQGSSVSCVLANVVLADADRSAVNALYKPDDQADLCHSLYLRYCDDVIVISKEKKKCMQAMKNYVSKLHEFQIPYHEPQQIKSYSKGFWHHKSKNPYPWSSSKTGIPWLSFLGYQIHHKRYLRIRKSSINKELRKQRSIVRDVFEKIYSAAKKFNQQNGKPYPIPSNLSIKASVTRHLLAISVGYTKKGKNKPHPNSPCWCNGFEVLHGEKVDATWLKSLDRGRRDSLKELQKRIEFLKKSALIEHKLSKKKSIDNSLNFLKDGPPFSYAKQFTSKD